MNTQIAGNPDTITNNDATTASIPVTLPALYLGQDVMYRVGNLITVIKASITYRVEFNNGIRDARPVRCSIVLDRQPNGNYDGSTTKLLASDVFHSGGNWLNTQSIIKRGHEGRFHLLHQHTITPQNQAQDLSAGTVRNQETHSDRDWETSLASNLVVEPS